MEQIAGRRIAAEQSRSITPLMEAIPLERDRRCEPWSRRLKSREAEIRDLGFGHQGHFMVSIHYWHGRRQRERTIDSLDGSEFVTTSGA
jgi:hypothetical protein